MLTAHSKRTVRSTALLLLCALLAAVALGGRGRAAATVTARLRPDITIVIDGSERAFYNAGGQQVHPILYDGTTYLPVRAIGELMGKNVDWNQDTKTVTLSGTRTGQPAAGTPDPSASAKDVTVELRDDFTVIVDGTKRTFADAKGRPVYPMLSAGSTYLPIRAIGELMGKSVSWDGATQTVTLSGSLVTDADTFSGGSTPPATGTTTPPATGTGLISVEDAKGKALAHAGLTAGQVTFVQQELEWEDGRQVYDIEFYTSDYKEYDYEIDAVTGEVRSFDYDAEHYTPSTGTTISLEKAREIALAKVPGAAATNIVKLELDHDDGRPVYEVEIIYNMMEYEMEIGGTNGTVFEFECESVHD